MVHKMRICIICESDFDPFSKAKREVGGLITHCPDCSEETETKYLGLMSADGKQAQATILKIESKTDREEYLRFWQNNSGFNKSKSCQLGAHLSTTPNINFKIVKGFDPTNHKGKA